jgi:hypothetical protein
MTDPFSVLPVKDAVIASSLSQRPVAQIDSTVEAYEPEPVKEKEFNLRPLQLHFGEYLRYHARKKEATDWTKQFKALLPGVVSDASLMVMGDLPVATFRRDARLSLSRLEREQPQIVAKYTRRVTKLEFDEEAFRQDEPLMHQAYRGRSFRLVNAGAGAGLVLPA